MPVLGNLGFADSTFSDADYGIAGIFLGGLSSIGGKTAVIIGIMLVLAVMFVLTYMKKNKNTEVIK